MGSILGGLMSVLSSPITSVELIGIIVCLLFRPERITNRGNFQLSIYLLVAAMILPGLSIILGRSEGGFIFSLIALVTILASAASVFLFVSSIGGQAKE